MKYFLRQLKKLYLLIAFVILLGIPCFLDDFLVQFEIISKIRFYGFMMQIIGGIVVIISLYQKNLILNNRTFWQDIVNGFKSLFKSSITLEVESAVHTITSTNVDLKGKRKPKNTFDDFLKYIDEEFEKLDNRISKAQSDNKKELQELRANLNRFKNSITDEINNTKKLLRKSAASNIRLELFGIGCIIYGLFFGTMSEEILKQFYC